jgi:5-methylcytosine-specific restriction endonuclease McrA
LPLSLKVNILSPMSNPAYKKMNGSSWITKERRLAIYLRDGFTCQSCERDMRNAAPAEVQLDHLVCRINGGSNDSSNLVLICRSCNSRRGATRWTKFYSQERVKVIRNTVRRKLNMALAKELVGKKAA